MQRENDKSSRTRRCKWFPLAVTATLMTACGNNSATSNAPPPVEVDVVTLAAAPAQITQELPGRVVAIRSAQVRARVEGVIERQLFADGSEVKTGTPLYQIDARTFQSAAAAAEAEVASQRALLNRYTPLLASKAISPQEFDTANARLKVAEANLAKAQLDLDNSKVLAPITGRAGRSLVTEGALVGKADATHLVTIEQLDPIRVEFTQAYADVLALKKHGENAKSPAQAGDIELTIEDGTHYSHPGRVKFSDLAVDPSTGAVTLRAEFPNPRRELIPGTFVRVRLPVASSNSAIRVPQRAVSTNANGQTVMVVDAENKVNSRSIKTLGFVGTDYLVADGLKDGERVIVNGLQKIKAGSVVSPIDASARPAATAAK